jgi:N-acetyl-anhydromuramyl-L-alanine amidase AmpD
MLLETSRTSPWRAIWPVVMLAACADQHIQLREREPDPYASFPPGFLSATSESDVPSEILFALARVETRFQMVQGAVEFDGQQPAYGLMGLRSPFLERAADLAGLDVETVKTDQDANLLAASFLLREMALELGIDFQDLDAWAPIVAFYSGIEDTEGAAEYVHHEVYGALRNGIAIEGYELPPLDVNPDYPPPMSDLQRGRDSSAIWTPSPNYNSRSGAAVDFVVIHTCEGTYSSCWSWLSNSASGVSAHYVVNDSGSEVRALVDESNRAWHISANYDCDNNSDVECWRDGTSMNTISVGIEHAGFASQSSWDPGLIQRSAELTCGITERNGIARDSYHIVGHGQLQPWNRTDPGPNWPWADYLNRVQSECGDVPASGDDDDDDDSGSPVPGVQFVIDSNNNANVTSQYYIEVSSNWWSSTSVAGYWNTGYWVAPTASVSDAASFWFNSGSEQCYKVEAWWTAGSDRPSSIAYIGWNPDDEEVGRATVSQRSNGGRWNHVGDWEFDVGWNRVLLSRWTTSGSYAIADAVRLTPSTACN